MAEYIKVLAALCTAEIIFELLMPDGGAKKQLKTVCSLLSLSVIVRMILSLFGR